MSASSSADEQDAARALAPGVERFRAVRRELEASVLPLATSLDGRRFTFQASLHGLAFRLGAYVIVEQAASARLGQVLELEAAQAEGAQLSLPVGDEVATTMQTGVPIRFARGAGVVLEGDDTPFHDATLRPATPEEVRAWSERTRPSRAVLNIGELALAPGVACGLDAGGFDRHTFLCGQSGSGKTYSLGVILERLLLETRLRMVVLDPNSDFIRLGSIRDQADPGAAARFSGVAPSVTVHSTRANDGRRLRMRLAELEPAAQAALLRLDAIADREEHAELTELLDEAQPPTIAAMEASTRPAARALALRARSLGLERWGVWAGAAGGSTLDMIHEPSARCTVVDLGSLATRAEQSLSAAAVLDSLWRRREARDPVLIVIDEAHNICPAEAEDPLTALAAAHATRIAAEGRKYGLYLLISTQRPQKVHRNIVSQCDNLVLMRLNSSADAGYAQEVFSFVPPSLIELSSAFRQGEALVAGKIAPQPALVRFGARIAEEGGSDVPATWAQSAP